MVRDGLPKLCIVVLAVAQPWPLEARELKVELIRGGIGTTTPSPVVRLYASGGEGGRAETTRKGFGDAVLQLGEDSVWTLHATAEGYWSTPAVATAATDSVRLVLWPAGRLVGSLAWPPGEDTPELLKMRFDPSRPEDKEAVTGRDTCSLLEDGRRFVCTLPAGIHDVALRVTGYVSHYFWDRTVTPGEEHNLGDLLLIPGSSVVGWLETLDGQPFDSTTLVELRPQLLNRGRDDAAKKLDRFDMKTRPNTKGFFHFAGAAEGFYSLRATQEGYAEAVVEGIEVVAGYESRLPEPLILGPPRELEVRVTPATNTRGGNWYLRLTQLRRERTTLAVEAECDELGFATLSGLPPGRFWLMVFEERGGRPFHLTELELERTTTFLDVELTLVEVEGTLLLGDEPLAARLLFGGSFSSSSAELRSDEDGKFHGYLPREGEWEVEVKSEEPPIRSTLRHVEVKRRRGQKVARATLRMPDLKLKGSVVDETSQPVKATIVIRPEGAENGENGFMTDDDGTFELRGLPEGRVHLTAGTPALTSDEIVVDLVEGREAPLLQIVVRSDKKIRGVVVSSEGRPVPGAAVGLTPWGALVGQTRSAVTNAQGSFEIELPEVTKAAHVLVKVPGYALHAARQEIADDSLLVLEVDRNWGELEILFPEGKEPWLQVARAGAAAQVSLLMSWARFHGNEGTIEPGRLVVPRLALGTYLVCLNEPGSAGWAAMYAVGQSLPDDECFSVDLQPLARKSVDLTGTE